LNNEKLTYPDGSTYTGETRDGKRHGEGTWVRPDGTRYEGQWENDKPDGKGTIVWPDGRKYTGQWKNGKRHGQGIDIRPDGKAIEGEWEEGEFKRKIRASRMPDPEQEAMPDPERMPEPQPVSKPESEPGLEPEAGAKPEPEAGPAVKAGPEQEPQERSRKVSSDFRAEPEDEKAAPRADLRSEGKGFLASLFDVSMKEMITPKIIRVIYIIGLIGIGLGAVGSFIVAIFTLFTDFALAAIFPLILIPVGAFVAVIFLRIYLELIILLFNIYDQLKDMNRSIRG